MKHCHGSSIIDPPPHFPLTCGSRSINPHIFAAFTGSKQYSQSVLFKSRSFLSTASWTHLQLCVFPERTLAAYSRARCKAGRFTDKTIGLTKVVFCWNHLKIPGHMQSAYIHTLKWNNMIDVIFNPRLKRSADGFSIKADHLPALLFREPLGRPFDLGCLLEPGVRRYLVPIVPKILLLICFILLRVATDPVSILFVVICAIRAISSFPPSV